MTTHDIPIRIRLGPSAADQKDKVFEADTLIGDVITYCKKDFGLPPQNKTSGEMIRYALYREQGSVKVKIDKDRSLRMLRIHAYEVLYLADECHIWWQGALPSRPGPATEPLVGGVPRLRPPSEVITPKPPPISTPLPVSGSTPCSIELAPGCVRHVPESGQIINRDYLIQQLPMSVSARERGMVLMGMQSRLESVSRDTQGHCSLTYRQGWYLLAHHTVYIGSNKHSNSEALPLEQTVTLLLGRNGWPITIRLHSTLITR